MDLSETDLFSVNESMINKDTPEKVRELTQQYKDIMDAYAEYTHNNNVKLANQNQSLFN